MADWHSPYLYRETNGSWTNVTYDDGICRYRYSHNTYDNQTYLNKYGDCSRIAVGPDGLATPIPMYGAPVLYERQLLAAGLCMARSEKRRIRIASAV